MSEKEKLNSPGGNDWDAELNFDEIVSHLAKGYENAQNVVRFLDTKAVASISAVPLTISIIFSLLALVNNCIRWEKAFGSPCNALLIVFVIITLIVAAVFLGSAVYAVWGAFDVIRPNDKGKAKNSLLFPFKSDDFVARLELFRGNPKRSDIFEDYDAQIKRMSEIVALKLVNSQQAISRLKWFFSIGFVFFTFMLITLTIAIILASIQR